MNPFSLFQYDFMLRAMSVSMILGVVCAAFGVFVVLRGMAFLSDAIAHFSLTGVAIGVMLGISPRFAAVAFCLVMGVVIVTFRERLSLQFDTSIGILFSSGLALGVILISLLNRRGNRINMQDLLFGDVLSVSPEDVWIVGGGGLVLLALSVILARPMAMISLNEELAEVQGDAVRATELVYVSLLSVTIALSIQMVGAILVGALMLLPAATAKALTRSFRGFVGCSLLVGGVTGIAGIVASFILDTPPGPTLVLVGLAGFLTAHGARGRLFA